MEPEYAPQNVQSKRLSHQGMDSDTPDEDDSFDETDIKNAAIQAEIDCFSQLVTAATQNRHLNSSDISNDDQCVISQAIMSKLDEALEMTTFSDQEITTSPARTSMPSHSRPYPPIHRSGIIHDHDRPFAEYGHLDALTLSQQNNFDLNGIENDHRRRLNKKRMQGKTWAITCWSDVPKHIVLDDICRQFNDERLQYVCVASEKDSKNNKNHLHIQIITKLIVNKKCWFLDEITGVHCNYQITNNDVAWNEYCKKGGDFIEFGEFKSPSTRTKKHWPDLPRETTPTISTESSSSSHHDVENQVAQQISVRSNAEQRRQRKIVTAERALLLAETDITKAMDLIRQAMPMEFMAHSSWYFSTFNYIRLQSQRKNFENMTSITKQYVWPLSFPNVSIDLATAMNRWIRHHFSRKSRAKCLILIGPTGIGKTSFALSLPGLVNYFKGRWNLDNWNSMARYSVYDDIGWDNFEKMNYPSKKDLLTQNGLTGATDKYRHSTMINVVQPAIVLLNPGKDEGSLTAKAMTKEAQEEADYWKKRAFIYRMKPGEYFYRRTQQNDAGSSNSSLGSNEERIGNPNEFIDAERCWLQQQQQQH
ncbi:unnamed protein product [Rotaria magnacalcarata]|uniref:Replication-associated protein n=4 Tax=Rotaria magnacalcarata TaxID=392030 RepID=A0A814PPU3_9BILA|nr:unnamed protein product [Rotaria magnacalcarata]CAF1595531.1 unnamed protein product [Rotaria magnacalcarata]CAF4082050.1 unnamed protein product [Rotaria magnacalcarata]CAF4089835.1 unnamed protein product [Rotaria magnacalcarata]